MRNILCKWFGHKFNDTELMVLDIMQNYAINKDDFKGKSIKCVRCGVPCSYTNNMVGLYENEAELELI